MQGRGNEGSGRDGRFTCMATRLRKTVISKAGPLVAGGGHAAGGRVLTKADTVSSSWLINLLAVRAGDLLVNVFVLMLLYSGWLPFEFRLGVGGGGSTRFLGLLVSPTGVRDVVSNIVLYMPLGVLLQYRYKGSGLVFRGMNKLFLVVGTTLAVEFGQLFIVGRDPSWCDVWCNTLGAVVGSMITPVMAGSIRQAQASVYRNVVRGPYTLASQAVVAAMVLSTLLPMTSISGLKKAAVSFMSADLTPMARLMSAEGGDVAGGVASGLVVRQRWMEGVGDLAADGGVYGLLAILMVMALRREYGFSRRATWFLAVWGATMVSGACYLLHLVAIGSVLDTMFPVVAVGGAMLGAGIALASGWDRGRLPGVEGGRRLWASLLGIQLAYIAYRGLIPFAFDASGGVGLLWTRFHWVPMSDFLTSRLPVVVANSISTMVTYGVVGALLAVMGHRQVVAGMKPVVSRAAMFAGGMGLVLELVQVMLVDRTAGITTAILAGVGGAAGVVAYRWVYDLRVALAVGKVPVAGVASVAVDEARDTQQAVGSETLAEDVADAGDVAGADAAVGDEAAEMLALMAEVEGPGRARASIEGEGVDGDDDGLGLGEVVSEMASLMDEVTRATSPVKNVAGEGGVADEPERAEEGGAVAEADGGAAEEACKVKAGDGVES